VPTCGSQQGAEPAGARVLRVEPGADGLDDEDVREPGRDGLATRAGAAELVGHEREGAVDPRGCAGCGAVDLHDGRQQVEQGPGRGAVDGEDAADELGAGTRAVVPQHRVVLADVLLGELVDPAQGGDAGGAEQQVAAAVRHEREVPDPQAHGRLAVDVDPRLASGDDVEAHAVAERGHLDRPVAVGLGAAVEEPGDA